MSRRWTHAANVVLCAACAGLGGGAYAGLLPARMGVLPFLALLLVVLCYGGAWWMQHSPSALNMPNQAAYDALPVEDQQRVIACTLPFFYGSVTLWTGFSIGLVFFQTTETIVVAFVLANIAVGAMTVRFVFLKPSRKIRELQEASSDKSQ